MRPCLTQVSAMFGFKKQEEPLTATYIENDGAIVIKLKGRLDSITAPDFQTAAVEKCKGRSATLDMENVSYLSSAGLRAILSLDKATGRDNKLTIINASGSVKEVLDMSGFTDFL